MLVQILWKIVLILTMKENPIDITSSILLTWRLKLVLTRSWERYFKDFFGNKFSWFVFQFEWNKSTNLVNLLSFKYGKCTNIYLCSSNYFDFAMEWFFTNCFHALIEKSVRICSYRKETFLLSRMNMSLLT